MHDDDERPIAASELAQMGFCERKVALDARHGARDTAAQAAAKERGRERHARFYEESRRMADASATRGRCFVATLALGESSQTRALRAWRDLVLRRTAAGRRLIALYYRCSPALCDWLRDKPRLLGAVRALLRGAARGAARVVARRTGRRP